MQEATVGINIIRAAKNNVSKVTPDAGRQFWLPSKSATEGVQKQPCLGLHCCLDVTCHALHTAAGLAVRDVHNSTMACQHLGSESHMAQDSARTETDVNKLVCVHDKTVLAQA